MAYSSSRMYRRPKDLGRLIELVKARNIRIETVASGRIDLTTVDGRMLAGILAEVDQAEADRAVLAAERLGDVWAAVPDPQDAEVRTIR